MKVEQKIHSIFTALGQKYIVQIFREIGRVKIALYSRQKAIIRVGISDVSQYQLDGTNE